MKDFIELLTQHNVILNINLTGGGSLFISDLMTCGGASKVLYGCTIPYNQKFLKSLIGEYNKCVCEEVAESMAYEAYNFMSSSITANCIGLGLTASLAKDDQRLDRLNEVYISAIADLDIFEDCISLYIRFDNMRDRQSQEEIIPIILRSWLHDILEKDTIEYQEIIL